VGVDIFPDFSFLGHNFGSRYARKPFKGSKDSDDIPVSKKNLSQKTGSLDWRPGPGKVGRKNAKTSPVVTSPKENPKLKKKISVGTRRFSEFLDGLNTSLALLTGKLWLKQSVSIYRLVRSLKGQTKKIKECDGGILNSKM